MIINHEQMDMKMTYTPTKTDKNSSTAVTETGAEITKAVASHACRMTCPMFGKCGQPASENLEGVTGQRNRFGAAANIQNGHQQTLVVS